MPADSPRNRLMPPIARGLINSAGISPSPPGWEDTPEFQLLVAYQVLVLMRGEKDARRFLTGLVAKKRLPGRPPGPINPEQDKQILALVSALNASKPMPNAQAAKLIHDAFPEYGPSADSIRMKIRRLKAAAG